MSAYGSLVHEKNELEIVEDHEEIQTNAIKGKAVTISGPLAAPLRIWQCGGDYCVVIGS